VSNISLQASPLASRLSRVHYLSEHQAHLNMAGNTIASRGSCEVVDDGLHQLRF
jgi:hypothetical protein